MVLGIFRIELNHKLVTSHLGDDGGSGNAGDLGVTLHNIALIGNGTQRIAVHEHAVGLQARVGNGTGDRLTKGCLLYTSRCV